MPALAIRPLHPNFGASIAAIDLAAPLADAALAALRAAIDRYSLLHFPAQRLDDRSQLALTRRLGTPEFEHVKLGRSGVVDYFGTVGNIGADGRRQGNDHADVRFAAGNRMWHSDSSFRPVPAFVSITCAHEVPARGGETEFASCRAAWARLPAAMQARIAPLTVVHDYVFSRSRVAPVAPSHARSLPPVAQRLVRANPATGARNYYVGSHARTVRGWSEAASRALLDDLLARATRARDIYRHRWQVGDVLIWDNRCLLHRGRAWNADRYRRRLRQTRVSCPGTIENGVFQDPTPPPHQAISHPLAPPGTDRASRPLAPPAPRRQTGRRPANVPPTGPHCRQFSRYPLLPVESSLTIPATAAPLQAPRALP